MTRMTQPVQRPGKYARVERERRFLLPGPPTPLPPGTGRRITDRYITGTRMRLRRIAPADERPRTAQDARPAPGEPRLPPPAVELKLTQKIPADRPGPVQGLITNTYLSPAEYDVFAALPARVLRKTRYSLPPFGIDVFDPPLHGLVLAEAEFDSDQETRALAVPEFAVAEVTADPRFTGGRLAATGHRELSAWLGGYGIAPPDTLLGNS